MKIKKNTFSTLVFELFFQSIANCKKLETQKSKNRLPLLRMLPMQAWSQASEPPKGVIPLAVR
jgi:hypothetical protein